MYMIFKVQRQNGAINGGKTTCLIYSRQCSRIQVNRYALSRYNIFGNEVITFEFNIQIMEDCSREYTISYHNEEDMNNIIEASAIVSEEMWNELTKDFFYAIDNVPPSMTFHEVFGELSSLYIH